MRAGIDEIKITLPRTAILDGDPNLRSLIEKEMRERFPSEISKTNSEIQSFQTFQEFLYGPYKDYKFIFLDPCILKPENLENKLRDIRKKYPDSALIISPSHDFPVEFIEEMINDNLINKYINRSNNPSDQSLFLDKLKKILNQLKTEGYFSLSFPISVYGSGDLADTCLKEAIKLSEISKVHWFSHTLATNTHTKKIEDKIFNFGYEEYVKYRQIPFHDKLFIHDRLDSMIQESLTGALIVTSSFKESNPPSSDRRKCLEWQYQHSLPKFKQLLDTLTTTNSRHLLVILSNPPEVLATKAILDSSIDPQRIVTASADNYRLNPIVYYYIKNMLWSKDVKNKLTSESINSIILGSHSDPIFYPPLVSVNGIPLNIFASRFNKPELQLKVEEALRDYGYQMKIWSQDMKSIGFAPIDAATETMKNIQRLSKCLPPTSFGYYQPPYKSFLFGIPPLPHYSNDQIRIVDISGTDPKNKLIISNQQLVERIEEIAESQINLAQRSL